MSWRGTQSASRDRHLAQYGSDEVDRYESWMLQLTREDDDSCLSDIASEFQFEDGMSVLDIGAGTGAMCRILSHIPGLSITALEPSSLMLAKLRAKPELRGVKIVEGFSDSDRDRRFFGASSFDAIVSRQLVNGLFDPIAAFRNWHHWLKPNGAVIVIDGLYDRSDWTGQLQDEVDSLPLSACRTTAMTPYLLESVGFEIKAVTYMEATNFLPSTRTQRYLVVATKHA